MSLWSIADRAGAFVWLAAHAHAPDLAPGGNGRQLYV
jgi:hypothetical protein